MSTRSVIARPTATGFKGVYHHWDGYPSGLGRTLFALAQPDGPWQGDVEAMLEELIDEHPAGWSSINGHDWRLEPGFVEFDSGTVDHGQPQCFCHGDRNEKGHVVTEENAADIGCEYAYVIDQVGMTILSSEIDGQKMIGAFGMGDPDATWERIVRLDFDTPIKPNWQALDAAPFDYPDEEEA